MVGRAISYYRITSQLGAGSMGEVYLAEDTRLHRKVALKILNAELTQDQSRLYGFTQEAQTASALSHPNILTIFDIGQEDAIHFIVTEYIEGQTLRAFLNTGEWTLTQILDVAIQIANGLAAAHRGGIVHTDLKPENIMLRADGLVKILDFGLARLIEKQTAKVGLNATAVFDAEENQAAFCGTVSYMSPEQARGETLDARTDIFSFGVTLYEMLAGEQPFDGESAAAVIQAILNDEPQPLSAGRQGVPLELESIIRKALEKNRPERYPAIEEMLKDLQQLRLRLGEDAHEVALPGKINQRAYATTNATSAIGSFQAHTTSAISASETGAAESALSTTSDWQAFVWCYRKWLLAASGVSATGAVFELLLFPAQSRSLLRGATFLLIAVAGLTIYFLARRKPARAMTTLAKGAAFRGLLPFQEADRHRFYGREIETLALLDIVAHRDFRFGVLFGESGCGKTSLTQAALVPKLWEAGFVPIYTRSYKDPLAAIIEECQKRSRINPRENELHADYLRRVADELGGGLVIICDQFEEFFVNFKTREERLAFITFIAACHNAADLPVKFLISMRSDFLYLINAEFAECIAEPLLSAKLYHLRTFDQQRAAEIIERSASRANLPFEKGLSKQVARDLAENGAVLPSELQIVGEQLQTKRVFTLQEYRRAGGKETLVHSFLENVIQAASDKEGASLLLRCLISDENTRLTLTLEEIARRMQRSPDVVEQLLNLFVGSRLIRELQEDEPWRYELMHEYLIDKINQVTGKVLDATQRANRLLRQYLSSYTVDKKTRVPLRNLLFIRRYADQASGERVRQLLNKSLRRGIVQGGLLALILATVAIFAAAAFSVSEEWESRRLSDGHTAGVRRAAFSPDGRLLVSCGEDKKVMVWDFARRERLATLTDHAEVVSAVVFSPDGRWFVTVSYDERTVIVWDTARLEKAFVLHNEVYDVGFSPDGRFLVLSGFKAVSYRVGSFDKVVEFSSEISGVGYIGFLPNSSRFVCSGYKDRIEFWDAATGKQESHELAGLKPGWLAVSPDGKMRMTVDGDGFVQFVDLEQVKILKSIPAHKDNGRSVAFSPDSRLAASGSENVILWDAQTQSKIATLEHEALVWSVAFSPDGKHLVSTHTDGAILVWDVAERQRIANLNEHSGAVYAVAYSPDGQRIASTGEDSSIIIWNATTGQKEVVLLGYKSRLNGVAFLPDGKRLFSTGAFEPAALWDLGRGEALRIFKQPTGGMTGSNGFAVSPDGRWLVTSNAIYETADGRIVVDFTTAGDNDEPGDDWLSHGSQIYGAAFSKDGRLLACATTVEKHLGLLDTANWQTLVEKHVPDSPFISVSFSPDGKYLATGDDNGKVELWSVDPLERIAMLGRHAARVKSVAFSPDGDQIASSSDDKTIALWNVGSRRLAARIGTHAAPVRALAFSPDGKHLVSGEHDKSVRIHTRHRVLWGYRLD
jgi:WD40 repeat protein/serine/threonine protein kinase